MEKYQINTIITLLVLSLAALLVPAVIYCIRKAVAKPSCGTRKQSTVSCMLVVSACLIASVWCLRYAVGYFSIISAKKCATTLTWLEEVFNSIVHALQTFSMDEDYTEYILNGKKMLGAIFGRKSPWITVYGVYAAILNFVAPIAGGAIIFEILASIFPKVRLGLSLLAFWKEKYYFSALNDASLALAKSIRSINVCALKKPVIVFADAYAAGKEESSAEMLLQAKSLGAICVRDDLSYMAKARYGKRAYFLMDEDELCNFQSLMRLSEGCNVRFIKNAEIYLFVQTDAYVQVEKEIHNELNAYVDKKLLTDSEKPTIIPVDGYRNLVHNLFVDVPLYEPLVHKKDNTKLSITILGNGAIGTEAFLSAYWFGQMLTSREENGQKTISQCELTINVVSKDSAEVFWSKIDYVNPEIRGTVEIPGKKTPAHFEKLLVCDDQGTKNNPYCKVRYIESDVKIGGFWDEQDENTQMLLESDYFIVALGNDADNISIADKLRRSIGKKHLEEGTDDATNNVVISYAVFDSNLAQTLNIQQKCQSRKKDKTDIFMYAFGSLEQVYSYDNVCMSRYKLLAEVIGASYNQSHAQNRLVNDNNIRKDSESSNYNYWANLARAMHIKYKVYSLGLIKQSIFDYAPDKEDEYKKYIHDQCKKYIEIALAETPEAFGGKVRAVYEDVQLKKHVLAWLEHRRWNAFTRTMGYQHTGAKNLFEVKNSQKDMELKLHSCLVEARRPELADGDTYIYADFMENGMVDKNSTFVSYATKPLDCLDQVSYERKKRNPGEPVDDFKMYDYYRYEFYEYFNAKDLTQLLNQVEIL